MRRLSGTKDPLKHNWKEIGQNWEIEKLDKVEKSLVDHNKTFWNIFKHCELHFLGFLGLLCTFSNIFQ